MEQNIFSYSRFALQYGLIKAGFSSGDLILVPDYNCDAIYYPLRQSGFTLRYYKLTDDFQPDWDSIRSGMECRPRAIMMVHYFGQPQPVEQFKKLCSEHNLLLIEDNAHGHSGTYQGRKLGAWGNIGFGSPRKQLNLVFGASLFLEGEEIFPPVTSLPFAKKVSFKMALLKVLPEFRSIRQSVRKKILSQPDFSDPVGFAETEFSDELPDRFSIKKLQRTNWAEVGAKRRDAWAQWVIFCDDHGLKPVWREPHPSSCPWIMPAYAATPEMRTKILSAAWDAGLGLLPWPSLPKDVLEQRGEAVQRWRRLVCFPLYKTPEQNKAAVRQFDNITRS